MKSLGNFPDPFLAEIAAQPDAIRRAAAALVDQRDVLDRIREAASTARTIVFTGMGSSYDACYPAVNDLAGRGVPSLLVDSAELLHFRRPILTAQTLVVILSQSGESAEIVRLATEISKQRTRPFVVSITNGLDNDLAHRADIRLDTWAGVETGPSTKTFAAAMTTLAGLAGLLAGSEVGTAIDRTRTAAEGAALAAERLLDDPEASADRLAEQMSGREAMVVLGRGPARAAAEMGALTLKESGVMAESLESAMFRHGPLELAGPGMSAIVLATEPETRRLDLALAADLVQAGAATLVITPDGEQPKGSYAVATGYLDRALVSAVSIVPVQLLAWKLATEAGRTPGAYTRASKVTTRE
ncbi:MAG: SIS domain-containing protein [Solirubrobacterales bacterium]|jgi:glucosamine--fructose-6-phosphate aminotransferase (isomerizing)